MAKDVLVMLSDRLDGNIFTPSNIANEMVDSLPKEIFNKELKVLDICCKSGRLLLSIYEKLMQSEYMINEYPNEKDRQDYIFQEQLFGLCKDQTSVLVSSRNLYGQTCLYDNIRYIKNLDTVMKSESININKFIAEEFGKDMKFNIVIGNPPYNKGMDLDFVHKGYQLSTDYTVMITPAKWQTTPDDYSGCASKTINYKQFRELYTKHMFKVCFYPDCGNVFLISQVDGITWYAMDKKTHDKCEVINKCDTQKHYNSVAIRSLRERERESLFNIGAEIVHSLGTYNKFKFNKGWYKRYQVWTNNQLTIGGQGGHKNYLLTNDGMHNAISISRIIDSKLGESSPSGASTCSFSSDNRAECESFISWLNTRFTRFFVAINISKLTGIINDDSFRFVPAPPTNANGQYKFDHIYTDQELYDYYKIPKQYQEVIESVIKERK